MSQTQTHTESLDGDEHDPDVQKKTKSRRPASTLQISSPQKWNTTVTMESGDSRLERADEIGLQIRRSGNSD